MNTEMRLLILLVAVAFAGPVSAREAAAGSWNPSTVVCKNGEMKRQVRITYEDSGSGSGCEVHYDKPSENPGVDRVLWSASRQPDYCQKKAASFIKKLEGWGWACEAA